MMLDEHSPTYSGCIQNGQLHAILALTGWTKHQLRKYGKQYGKVSRYIPVENASPTRTNDLTDGGKSCFKTNRKTKNP